MIEGGGGYLKNMGAFSRGLEIIWDKKNFFSTPSSNWNYDWSLSSSRIWLSAINHFVSCRKNQWSGTGWKHRRKHTKRLSSVSLKHLFSRIWFEWRCHCICWCRGSWCLFTARKPTSRLCVKITKQYRVKLCSNRKRNVSYPVFGISKFHQHFYGKNSYG